MSSAARCARAILALLALVGLVIPVPAWASRLELLSYNVRGIPPVVTFLGRPGTRIPLIVERLREFDVALLQETFSYQDVIERCATNSPCVYYRGAGRRFRWGNVIAAPVLMLCWLTPRCRLPANSGLMTVVQSDRVGSERIVAEQYERCWGYLIGGNDCFAAKGFVLVRITLPDGEQVDLYDTHLDAGKFRYDRSVRRSQLEHLGSTIREHSRGRAVVLAGDFNSRRGNGPDTAMFEEFRISLNLVDSSACRAESVRPGSKLDRLLFRSGDDVQLDCLRVGEDQSFTYERSGKERPLSDHRPLTASFDVSRPRAAAAAR